ncbi:hypothetical protein [Mucilaginibacter sp.]|uniref:hypothetical protein n=1 Tax=Mucilaginibacter sp. TaxID=1882438 RepID=UPI003B001087
MVKEACFTKANLRLLELSFFCLETKRTKNSRMPDRLRAAFRPTLLGGYFKSADLANGLSQLIFMTAVCFLSDASFTTYFLILQL